MKNIVKISIFVSFISILILTPIIYYAIKYTCDEKVIEKIDFDLKENREYNDFECKSIVDFPISFEKYFNDHVPFRSFLIQEKRNMESFVERPYVQGIEDFLMNFGKKSSKRKSIYMVHDEKYMDYAVRQFTNHALMPWEEDVVSDDPYPLKLQGDVIMGKKNWFFLYSNNTEYYKGTNILKDNQYKSYVKKLEDLDILCKEKGKRIIYLVIPEKERIYGEYMPQMERVDTVGRIEKIEKYIASYSNISYIYPKTVLSNEKKYYRVYRKYDTHYNNVGAYIVHNEMMKAENKKYIDIDDVCIDKIESKNKDLVWLSGQSDANYKDDVEYYLYYYDDIQSKKTYEDHNNDSGDVNTWIDIYESDVDNDESIVLYGDSFKENLKQFLSKDYKKSIFVGTNNPNRKKILKDNIEACDIIVIETVERNEGQLLNTMIKEVTDALKTLKSIQND